MTIHWQRVTISQMRIVFLCPLWLTSLLLAQELPKEPLANITQLTTGFSRAGEGYFSPDMKWIIFQAVPPGEEHYQMYIARLHLADGKSPAIGTPIRISPEKSRNTCGYFSPDGKSLIFASTAGKEKPDDPTGGYQRQGLDLQDLIAEGNLGLMRAVEAFDPTQETRLSTYASYWIKQSIKRTLINTAKTIRLPAYMVELLTKWRRATAKLQEALGRAPTQEEIASSLRLSKKKLGIIQKALRIYNAAPQTDQSEEGWSIDELLTDGHTKSPEREMLEADDLRHVLELLDEVTREQHPVDGVIDGDETHRSD